MGKQTRDNVHLSRRREACVTSDSSDSHFSTRCIRETVKPHTLTPSMVQGKLLDFVMANKEPTGRVAGRETVVAGRNGKGPRGREGRVGTAQERRGATSGVSVTNHSGAATG